MARTLVALHFPLPAAGDRTDRCALTRDTKEQRPQEQPWAWLASSAKCRSTSPKVMR